MRVNGSRPSSSGTTDRQGNFLTTLGREGSPFNEIYTKSIIPFAQINSHYGIDKPEIETFIDTSPGTGSVDVVNSQFRCQTGTGIGGYGVIRTRRPCRYRTGQGTIFRFDALFSAPVALSLQAAGAFSSTNGVLVGYNGLQFGIMHRYGGLHPVYTLQVTGAAGGSENATVTLDGVPNVIPLTAGSVEHNASEIADWLTSNNLLWEAYQDGDSVDLFRSAVGPVSGGFSFSSSTATATLTQEEAGVSPTEDWTYQADFSIDKLDGSGDSGMTIDPTKGNVFKIEMQSLNQGDIIVHCMDQGTGKMMPIHRISLLNQRDVPTFNNPSLKVGWIAASLGSTTNLTVRGNAAFAGIAGDFTALYRPRAESHQRASVGATLVPIISFRVKSIIGAYVQLGEMLPKIATLAPDGSRVCEGLIPVDATLTGPEWSALEDGKSIVDIDTNASAVSGGRQIAALTAPGGGKDVFNFSDLKGGEGSDPSYLLRGEVITIAARIIGGGGNDVTASLSWIED